jgi:hypothetical protein
LIPLTDLTISLLDDNDWNFPFEDYVKEKKKPEHLRLVGTYRDTYNRLIRTFLKRFSIEMPSFAQNREDKSLINKTQYIDLVPRYKRFGSHSGRRTAVSLMMEAGVPETEGMLITGHFSLEVYRGYADIRPISKKNYLKEIFD